MKVYCRDVSGDVNMVMKERMKVLGNVKVNSFRVDIYHILIEEYRGLIRIHIEAV